MQQETLLIENICFKLKITLKFIYICRTYSFYALTKRQKDRGRNSIEQLGNRIPMNLLESFHDHCFKTESRKRIETFNYFKIEL